MPDRAQQEQVPQAQYEALHADLRREEELRIGAEERIARFVRQETLREVEGALAAYFKGRISTEGIWKSKATPGLGAARANSRFNAFKQARAEVKDLLATLTQQPQVEEEGCPFCDADDRWHCRMKRCEWVCERCRGRGEVVRPGMDPGNPNEKFGDPERFYMPCPVCHGTGKKPPAQVEGEPSWLDRKPEPPRITEAMRREIEERRDDPEFRARLERSIEENRELLDRLEPKGADQVEEIPQAEITAYEKWRADTERDRADKAEEKLAAAQVEEEVCERCGHDGEHHWRDTIASAGCSGGETGMPCVCGGFKSPAPQVDEAESSEGESAR